MTTDRHAVTTVSYAKSTDRLAMKDIPVQMCGWKLDVLNIVRNWWKVGDEVTSL